MHPCSFAFFLVRKWKKQEHLRWPTGPAGGPGDIGFQYFQFKTHSERRKIKMGPEDLREKPYDVERNMALFEEANRFYDGI